MADLEKHINRNVINGRDLRNFERTLGFKRGDLEGHKVLNFGSGGSNIGKELKASGVNCEIVDVDILPNPHSVHDENFTPKEYVSRRATLVRKIREDAEGQLLLKPIEEYENKLLGIDGRNFIQLDGSGKLPFKDGFFDDVFVSWVFHQIPEFERESYLREFMRIGKRVFISPIGRREFREIEFLLRDSQFTIRTLTHWGYGVDETDRISDEKRKINRSKGLTDDGYVIHDLSIDYGERPYSVNASGCARIIIEKS